MNLVERIDADIDRAGDEGVYVTAVVVGQATAQYLSSEKAVIRSNSVWSGPPWVYLHDFAGEIPLVVIDMPPGEWLVLATEKPPERVAGSGFINFNHSVTYTSNQTQAEIDKINEYLKSIATKMSLR